MAVYMEKPNIQKFTMMTLVAKDASFLSTPYSKDPHPITDNTIREKFS